MDEALRQLQQVSDPVERAKRATALLADYQAGVTEAARIRREAFEELRAQGMSQTEIAQAVGLTRGRIGQLAKSGPPPERALLGAGPLTVAVALKREADRGRPVVAQETMAAVTRLQQLAQTLDLELDVEYVPPPGNVRLNRDDLIVICGPRLSPLVAQVLEADQVLAFRKDDAGWYLVDQREGIEYRSPRDVGDPRDVGYVARLPRPDGRGVFLYLAGVHATGTNGVVHYLQHGGLQELYTQARQQRFSALVECTFDADTLDVVASQRITPVYKGGE